MWPQGLVEKPLIFGVNTQTRTLGQTEPAEDGDINTDGEKCRGG